jgi:site-specific DNA-methyltransferase (adenine-specific)
LPINETHHGDARDLLPQISKNSVSLSVWSPPYFVGKNYESYLTYQDWESLLKTVIANHFKIIKPGGFLVINISDILCFKDETMPKIQAEVLTNKRCSVTREDVLAAMEENPDFNRYKIAKLLGCSEQTVDRRLNGNNIRGGKYDTQTRVKVVGGIIENFALDAGFYPYDRRVWVKDAAWENSRWASLSYRAVDEFEYIYVFWKPGITRIDRKRLTKDEWRQWGARGVWEFPSVRANDDHEAKFPVELPTRVIRLLTDPGELVLDCFMGSGTSAIAAINTDRNFIGIELDKKYADLANKQAQKAMKNAIRPK